MDISTDLVLRLADLTRLDMSEAEAETFRQDLTSILDYFQNLNGIDTTHISPTARISEGEARLGEDIPGESFLPEDLSQLAGEVFDVEQRVFVLQGVLPAGH